MRFVPGLDKFIVKLLLRRGNAAWHLKANFLRRRHFSDPSHVIFLWGRKKHVEKMVFEVGEIMKRSMF